MQKTNEKKLDQILKDLETETAAFSRKRAAYSDLIAKAETAAKDAEKALSEASEAENLTAYSKAKNARQEALDAAEMYRDRLRKLDEAGRISEADYNAWCNTIKAIASEEWKSTFGNIKALSIKEGETARAWERDAETLRQILGKLGDAKPGKPLPTVPGNQGFLYRAHASEQWANGLREPQA